MKKQILRVKAKIVLEIPGDPRPKRTGSAGLYKKGNRTFPTIKKNPLNEKAEENIQAAFFEYFSELDDESKVKQILSEEPWDGLFAYKHTYYFEMTKEEKRKYKDYEKIYHTKKPDSDNLHKMTNDALEGFIFKNDCAGIDKGGPKYSWHKPGLTIARFWLLEEV